MRNNDLHIRIAAGSALERWLASNSHTTKTQAVHDLATRYEELKRVIGYRDQLKNKAGAYLQAQADYDDYLQNARKVEDSE